MISAEASRGLLLRMSQEQSAPALLAVLVDGLVETCGAALARVWVVGEKSDCGACSHPPQCEGRSHCLQLAASAGRSLDGTEWSGTAGDFSRMPFGFGKVGHIALTRESVEVRDIAPDSPWIARPEWVTKEQIRGLIGQPLLHRGELLGVLAVFTRESPTDDDLAWLRAFADHAAAALANRRAFDEIERLRSQLEQENEYLRNEVREVQSFGEIVGDSPVLRNAIRRVELVAPTDATVLIQGESGTGKELIARAIWEHSPRAKQPIVTVNCAAIPPELFESEFFGHVKGAFSGAARDRVGRFSLADRGTIVLDEVGEIPLNLQGKLLRVLEQGTFERVGEDRTRRLDVRVIAATNRDLVQDVRDGTFRKDLYYRLSVFVIDVPPLRERIEDIVPLAQHFLDFYSRKYRLKPIRMTRQDGAKLEAYPWPGNVRELRNVIERSVITRQDRGPGLGIDLDGSARSVSTKRELSASRSESGTPETLRTEAEIRALERRNLVAVLKQTEWKVAGPGGAAEFLGIHPATLASRLRTLKITRSTSEQSHDE